MLCKFAALTALVFGCAGVADANVIAPGQSGPPDALNPDGIQLVQTSGVITATNPVTGAIQYTVNYTVGVYLDPANPFCAGCLNFDYVFTDNGLEAISGFSVSDFAGVATDIGYVASSSGAIPTSVDRSAGLGDVVHFNYSDPNALQPGSSTAMLMIATDSTTYLPGSFTIQDGISVTGVGYGPTAATTPEPTSLALFGTGLLGVIGAARRRLSA